MKLSVLMPVFNTDPEFLSEAIDSILAQTFPHFEFLIYDDCSTRSDTLDMLEQYALRDERIRVIHGEKNVGLSGARNRLMDEAAFSLCAHMDSDDIADPRRLEKQVEVFQKHPDVGICGTWYHCFPSGIDVCHPVVPSYLDFLQMDCLGNPTVMYNKDIWKRYGFRFREDIRYAEDYELYSRMIRYVKVTNVPALLLNYRERQDSLSHIIPEAMVSQDYATRGSMLHFLSANPLLRVQLAGLMHLPGVETLPRMFPATDLRVPMTKHHRTGARFRLPVIVRLQGGLGNQMFQYAFGCALSHRLHRRVLYDFSWFSMAEKTITNAETRKNERGLVIWKYALDLFSRKVPRASRFIVWLTRLFGGEVMEPEGLCRQMHASLISRKRGGVWEGYFQNEGYYKDIRWYLESIFVFPPFPNADSYNQKLLQDIRLYDNSVFVHVRRGDFVVLGWELPASYYSNAVAYLVSRLNDPHFFVFGNEVPEIMEAMRTHSPHVEWVGDNNSKNHEDWKDISLMMNCKHAIVANSTFSWWAAWIGKPNTGIVVAPSPYLDGTDDGICESWIKIPR